MNEYTGGLLIKYFVYQLTGENWSVHSTRIADSKVNAFIAKWNKYYNEDIDNVILLCQRARRKIDKTMRNSGCDMFSALKYILEELDIDKDDNIIYIAYDEFEPRISLKED